MKLLGKMWYNVVLAVALFLGTPAAKASDWTHTDTVWATLVAGVLVVDWLQTREIVKHPDRWEETNPLLGPHPSMRAVNTHFAVAIASTYLISRWLPADARRGWQVGLFVGESLTVVNNHSNGIRIRIAI